MTELKPIFALGKAAPTALRAGALTLTEKTDYGIASLAVRKDAAVPTPFGMTLPDVGGCTTGPLMTALWAGPGAWVLMGEDLAAGDFAADIKAQSPDCSVTEQTDGFAVFEIVSTRGADAITRFLEKTVNIDPRKLVTGTAVRTGFEHLSCLFVRTAPERLLVLGMRSAAGSIWDALATTACRID